MKRLLTLFLLVILLLVMTGTMVGCGCDSEYEDYNDFQRNASPREAKDFYDWWAKNP